MQTIVARFDGRTLEATDPRPVPWWSLAKTALAAAALALVAQGRLDLDAPVDGKPFALRHLLRHDAGLVDYGSLPDYHRAVDAGETPWSEQDLLRRVEAERLRYAPGAGWDYSNVGYLLVRRLIERTADAPLDVALDRLVFRPLDVAGVTLASTPADLAACAWGNAAGYHPAWVYHGLLLGPAGAAALFVHRLLDGGLLPPPLLAAMRTPHRLGGALEGRPWRSHGYGLGLMIDPESQVEGHTGGGPGSASAAYRFSGATPPRTVAAFAPGTSGDAVEHACWRLAGATTESR